MDKTYFVYMMSNKNRTVIYTGITSNIVRRVYEHKSKSTPGFSAKYNIDRLVYVEKFINPTQAIKREKCIKGGSRAKKIALIQSQNKQWEDLASDIKV